MAAKKNGWLACLPKPLTGPACQALKLSREKPVANERENRKLASISIREHLEKPEMTLRSSYK